MTIDYRAALNDEQHEAATTLDGPLLILAGAGSGKTTTLIYRVAYMIDSGIAPENILLLTFTNKAADEMKHRAEGLLDDRCGKITACTFHSFCNMQLRRFAKAAGLPSDFTILSPSDVSDIISMIKADHNWNKIKGFPPSKSIASLFSMAINTGATIGSLLDGHKWSVYLNDLLVIEIELAAYKKERGLLDFDDLLLKFRDLLIQKPEVAEGISDAYRYIMVDEYQDTNTLQEDILLLLRQKNHNLAVVGDDAQGIYQFRGANITNITQFESRMPNTKRVTLSVNYRSNQEIVSLSNDVLNYSTTECFHKHMRGTFEARRNPEIIRNDSAYLDAMQICEDIQTQHKKGRSYSDLAVLVRNSMHSYVLETMLSKEGIPYRKIGGLKFLERAYVGDILSFLRVLVNSKDEIAWYRVLQVFSGIGKNFSQKISALAPEMGEGLLTSHPYGKRSFAAALSLFAMTYSRWQTLPLDDLLLEIIEFYYTTKLEQIQQMRTESEENRALAEVSLEGVKEELGVLLDMAKPYDTALEFLDALTLASDALSSEDSEDMVTISTIHSAKGLEWDTVYVMHCADRVFPVTTNRDLGSEEDNEELRCFYVAITRAANRLVIFCPKTVLVQGETIAVNPSHYLTNVPYLAEKLL